VQSNGIQQYSQRFEASLPAEELSPELVKLTELEIQRLTFDDFLHGEDDRDLDRPRLLQINQSLLS